MPIAEKGFLEFMVRKDLPGIPSEQSGRVMRVAIKQIHLEQDSGRIQYNPRDPDGNTTVVDFRRSGVPPMMSLAHAHTHLMYSSGYTYLGVYGRAVMIFIACSVQGGALLVVDHGLNL